MFTDVDKKVEIKSATQYFGLSLFFAFSFICIFRSRRLQ